MPTLPCFIDPSRRTTMEMGLDTDLQRAAEIICDAESVTIVSHIDADGISTESILAQALSREAIPVTSVFVRQLEPMAMRHVPKDGSLKLFTDLGAGQQGLLAEHGLTADEVLILDHHVSQPGETAYPQVNSLDHGITRMSAAGVAYLVAKAIDATNIDLAKLAVVGNVGDMMARENCGLVGPAREIVSDGVEYGNIIVQKPDLNCYGTSTRPVHTCLAYCDDPYIDGISNSTSGALRFLERLGVTLKNSRSTTDARSSAPLPSSSSLTGGRPTACSPRPTSSPTSRNGHRSGTPRSTPPCSTPAAGGQSPGSGGASAAGTGGTPTVTRSTCSPTTARSSATCSSTSSIPG